jgi:uncharacterized protein YcbK (DUF882 family)
MAIRQWALAAALAAAMLGHAGTAIAAPGRSGGDSTSRACLKSEISAVLARIEAKFGRVQVVSTCRPGARIAGTGKLSRHATGDAVDFRVPGRKGRVIKWLIANHHSGGIMTYRGMDHIHVDVGYRFISLAKR